MKTSSQQSKNKLATIAKVLKPRGLSGEVKVQILTNKLDAFTEKLYLNGFPFETKGWQAVGLTGYLKLDGIDTLEKAESLRGKLIQIPRDKLPLDDDEVLADDLIGFEVVGESGEVLGTVKNIQSVGASEVFDCGTFMFPNEDAFVIETNMKTRRIIIRTEMLEEEICD